MTGHRRDEPFEVPVERLPNSRRDGRRATVAAVMIVAVVGGAVGLARWTPDEAGVPPRPAGPSAAPAASGIAAASDGPSAAPRRSTDARIERLLNLPDRALDGGPTIDLVEQDGLDLRVLRWTPGAGLAPIRTFRGAVAEPNQPVVPVLAPAGERVALLVPENPPRPGVPVVTARVVDTAGSLLWTDDDIALESGALWAADGGLVAIAGIGRRWHLIEFAPGGRVRDRVIELPGEIFLPSPISVPRIAPRTVPLGFSANGDWIYGGIVEPELGLIGEFRVAADGGRVERVGDLGVGRRDGLVPVPGTVGGQIVDPVLGRIANLRWSLTANGGPPTLEVRNPDAGLAFSVDAGVPLGSGWDADGSLHVLSADTLLYTDSATLARIRPDGTAEAPILASGPITSAGLLGIRDGYAAVALWTTKPDSAAQIVLVDLADPGRISALGIAPDGLARIIGADLRP